MTFERANIQAMIGYTSGEQPDSPSIIKLNTNENPFPAGPAVEAALSGLKVSNLRRYPPPTAKGLSQAIADLHGLQLHNIMVTNGGDELLRLAIATFVEQQESIGVAEPSYSLYPVLAAAQGCQYVTYQLADDWSLPDDYAQQLNRDGIKMCFVVNPQAPSGCLIPVAELKALADAFNGVLVIDEAYIDFVNPDLEHNTLALIKDHENVLILRTFSKGYSLAGLRMGYGIGAASLISPMQTKTRDSYNTDFISQALAKAAITDQRYAQETWQYVRNQRDLLGNELKQMGFSFPNSQSNFLLVTAPAAKSAIELYEGLKTEGVLVRYFDTPRLNDKLRITIGTQEENTRLLATLGKLLG